jgi:hypothetical protein
VAGSRLLLKNGSRLYALRLNLTAGSYAASVVDEWWRSDRRKKALTELPSSL